MTAMLWSQPRCGSALRAPRRRDTPHSALILLAHFQQDLGQRPARSSWQRRREIGEIAVRWLEPTLGDHPIEDRLRFGWPGTQFGDDVATLGHIEDLALLDAIEVDGQVLPELPDADPGPWCLALTHVAHGST